MVILSKNMVLTSDWTKECSGDFDDTSSMETCHGFLLLFEYKFEYMATIGFNCIGIGGTSFPV